LPSIEAIGEKRLRRKSDRSFLGESGEHSGKEVPDLSVRRGTGCVECDDFRQKEQSDRRFAGLAVQEIKQVIAECHLFLAFKGVKYD
jgi:hypothetical protein